MYLKSPRRRCEANNEQNPLPKMTKMQTKIMIHMKMKMLMMKMMVMTERLPFSTRMSCQQHMKLCVLRAGSQHTCRIQDQDLNVVLQVCCLMFLVIYSSFYLYFPIDTGISY